jgi:hypothetical protein
MQQADGIALSIIGAERVRANQLSQLLGLVRFGRANRAHFVENHWNARARELPSSLRTG